MGCNVKHHLVSLRRQGEGLVDKNFGEGMAGWEGHFHTTNRAGSCQYIKQSARQFAVTTKLTANHAVLISSKRSPHTLYKVTAYELVYNSSKRSPHTLYKVTAYELVYNSSKRSPHK